MHGFKPDPGSHEDAISYSNCSGKSSAASPHCARRSDDPGFALFVPIRLPWLEFFILLELLLLSEGRGVMT
jgi:hypothetical protein